MLRRDFFKAFTAATAAFYAAKSGVASVAAPKLPAAVRPKPQPSSGSPEVDYIISLLDRCSVVSISRSDCLAGGGFSVFEVTYVYEEGREMNDALAGCFDSSECRMRSVMVNSIADAIDMTSFRTLHCPVTARHEIVVEWIGPASALVFC
jgi:hypothetical protein